jgi:hypothetical protein
MLFRIKQIVSKQKAKSKKSGRAANCPDHEEAVKRMNRVINSIEAD